MPTGFPTVSVSPTHLSASDPLRHRHSKQVAVRNGCDRETGRLLLDTLHASVRLTFFSMASSSSRWERITGNEWRAKRRETGRFLLDTIHASVRLTFFSMASSCSRWERITGNEWRAKGRETGRLFLDTIHASVFYLRLTCCCCL